MTQKHPSPDKLLLRVRTAANQLDVSLSQAYNLINSGELPAVRISKSIRIPVQALNEYIARKTAEGLR